MRAFVAGTILGGDQTVRAGNRVVLTGHAITGFSGDLSG